MKKIKFYFFFIIFILLSNYSYSQNIAYANMDKIIKTSEVGKKIIKHFSEKSQNLIDEIKKKEADIKNKENNLISQKSILQPDEYTKKVELIKKEIADFNKINNIKIKKINSEKENVLKLFLIEINKIIKDFVEKNNIDIVISSNSLIIGKSDLDVTDKILNEVNNKIRKFNIKKDG